LVRPLAYLLTTGIAVLAAIGVAVPGLANPAAAANTPSALTIDGPGLATPLSVRDTGQTDLFSRLLHQVSWMDTRPGDQMTPDPAGLGPRYRLTVLAGTQPVERYDVYPQATGGPKAFRPADQPQGRTSDAWFYVSLSLPELLHAAGVPDGGPAGGAGSMLYRDPAGYVPMAASSPSGAAFNVSDVLRDQRRPLLVWFGAAFGVLLLVIGAAGLSRRYSQARP